MPESSDNTVVIELLKELDRERRVLSWLEEVEDVDLLPRYGGIHAHCSDECVYVQDIQKIEEWYRLGELG